MMLGDEVTRALSGLKIGICLYMYLFTFEYSPFYIWGGEQSATSAVCMYSQFSSEGQQVVPGIPNSSSSPFFVRFLLFYYA